MRRAIVVLALLASFVLLSSAPALASGWGVAQDPVDSPGGWGGYYNVTGSAYGNDVTYRMHIFVYYQSSWDGNYYLARDCGMQTYSTWYANPVCGAHFGYHTNAQDVVYFLDRNGYGHNDYSNVVWV